MLLTLIISHLFVLVAANPFHKYPYVFLLDVGNEEIQKTTSEQIRVSIPGGTLALRYPAIGEKDTIAHVRVSGIDFGTDLKANIIDGGPGYKYVVIVFMGNQGMPYDAVVTIQTMENEEGEMNPQDIRTNKVASNIYEVSEDENNSAEEIDEPEYLPKEGSKSHLSQASENKYHYAENEAIGDHDFKGDLAGVNSADSDDDDSDDDDNDDYSDDKNSQNKMTDIKNEASVDYDQGNDEADEDDDDDETNTKNGNSLDNGYTANEYYNKEETVGVVDNLYYDRANYIRPFLYNGIRVFPEQVQYMPQGGSNLGAADDEGYNDDIHNEGENMNFKDSNNNNFDSEDSSAVAS